ncbi:MAG TPA: hypothetical protein VI997_00790 [Candidatus Thermoplasmatota archaeon]|nr:hypothetical protein [Candidatus Thermoplasmatota archaeon]
MATNSLDELLTWARRFREEDVPFMVVGASAVAIHGLPRSSDDIDIVIHTPFEQRARVADLLRRHALANVHERIDPQWGKRLAGDLPSEMTLELFFTPPNPVHDREFARRVFVSVRGEEVPFISAEDLVLRKLVNMRLRHGLDYDDVVGVIATQGRALDLEYLRAHAGFYRVGEILERAIKEAAGAEPAGTT